MFKRTKAFNEERLRKFFGQHWIVDRHFQARYTIMILSLVAGAMLPIAGLTLYFLNQNYRIFMDMALIHSPDLLGHLEREKIWINIVVVSVVITITTLTALFSLRITGRMVLPLILVREHIKSLTRGEWSVADIEPSENEEFYELVEAYGYFYKSLKYQTKSEFERLKMVEGSDKILSDLIVEKAKRLSISETNH